MLACAAILRQKRQPILLLDDVHSPPSAGYRLDRLEARGPIEVRGRVKRADGPEDHRLVAGVTAEGDRLLYQAFSQPCSTGLRRDEKPPQLRDVLALGHDGDAA